MTEEWRTLSEFPDYAVSSEGRVKRVAPDYRGRAGHILKPHASRYASLTLYLNRKPAVVLVHRLVCSAFHGDPPSLVHEVAHGDGNSLNNRAQNLRWATRIENEADKVGHGTSLAGRASAVPIERRPYGERHGRYTKPEATARGERAGRAKLTEGQVAAIRSDPRVAREIAGDHGVTRALIQMIKANKIWRHV